MTIHLRNNRAKFHPESFWNDEALWFFEEEEVAQQKKQQQKEQDG